MNQTGICVHMNTEPVGEPCFDPCWHARFDPRVVLDPFQPDAPCWRSWYRATNELGTVYITDSYREAVRWLAVA